MSVKKIVRYGTKGLREKSKEVHKISKKIQALIRDLLDTLYSQNGVGLAAPQIGENLRVFVIDVSQNDEPLNPIIFINPKIIKKSGAVNSNEGCLSFPKVYTDVRRYKDVTVKAIDQKGKPFTIEATDGTLFARAIQHEFDHLDGVLFIDHARNRFETDQLLIENDLPTIEPDLLLDEADLEVEIANSTEEKKD